VPWITRRSEGRSCTAPSPSRPRGPRAAIASEFTKIGSVRSTYWTLAALLIVSVGIGAAACAGLAANISNNAVHKAGYDATQDSLFVFFEIGQLIIAVLGALTITAEYSTGMIRTSLTAMPRRGVVYAAKAIVFTSVTLVISLVTSSSRSSSARRCCRPAG
jgi:ABC-2 type transport system permease protein